MDFVFGMMIPARKRVGIPAVELWVAVDAKDCPQGFIGLNENHVEMLFIEPDLRGKGVGRALLDHARSSRSQMSVDVNEQNPEAAGFYLHYGFIQTGRSPLDGEGRPFPLLHLSLVG
ncbi:MAG: GNAT family N-acetyltransferase [Pseudomonas gingeri]